MKKKLYKEIPTGKIKEFIRIYNVIKAKHEEIKKTTSRKFEKAIDDINKIHSQLEKLAKCHFLTPYANKEIREKLNAGFFQSISSVYVGHAFGREKISITENKKLKVTARRGGEIDYALDILICLLVFECGNDFKRIAGILTSNDIPGHDTKKIRQRFKRINRHKIKEQYANFVTATMTGQIVNSMLVCIHALPPDIGI